MLGAAAAGHRDERLRRLGRGSTACRSLRRPASPSSLPSSTSSRSSALARHAVFGLSLFVSVVVVGARRARAAPPLRRRNASLPTLDDTWRALDAARRPRCRHPLRSVASLAVRYSIAGVKAQKRETPGQNRATSVDTHISRLHATQIILAPRHRCDGAVTSRAAAGVSGNAGAPAVQGGLTITPPLPAPSKRDPVLLGASVGLASASKGASLHHVLNPAPRSTHLRAPGRCNEASLRGTRGGPRG